MRKRGYRTFRPSLSERSKLLEFHKELYSRKTVEMATKSPVKKSNQIMITGKDGTQLPLPTVKSYAETDYFQDNGTLFPQLAEAIFSRESEAFDDEGRPNITGKNLVIVDVVHMTKGEFGPYFAMHVLVDDMGEFSVLTRGQVVNETIAGLTGISLETGKRIAPSELPVAIRVVYERGKGEYQGYFTVLPPAESLDD